MSNFDIFEMWEKIVSCFEIKDMNISLDLMRLKEMVLLLGYNWNEDFYKRICFLESLFKKKMLEKD